MREEITRRPLLVSATAFALGLSTTFVWWHVFFALPFPFLVREKRATLCWCLFFALGWVWRPVLPTDPVWETRPVQVVGRIASVPTDVMFGRQSLLDAGGRRYVLVTDQDVSIGDTVRVGGRLKPLREGSGTGHGAVGELEAIGGLEVVSPGPFLGRWGLALRDSFRRFVDRSLRPKDAALVDGIAFNVSTQIDEGDYRALARSGVVPVISTSGVHVVLVAGFLAFLARKTPVPRPWSLALLAVLLVVYACAAGLRPPMVRSVGMALIALSAYMFRREPDGMTSLAAASLVTLLCDAWAVAEAGFWLSVVAVGGLVLFVDPFKTTERRRDPQTWLRTAFTTSVVASAATLPIIASMSGQLPLVGPLANLMAIPASELLLMSSLLSWLVSLVFYPLGHGLLVITSGPLLAALRGAASAGLLPAACPGVPGFSVYWCVWVYGLALAFWRPWVRPA